MKVGKIQTKAPVKKRLALEAALLFLAAWALGVFALAEGIPWGDSPELTISAAKLLNAHTTGYPLWLMMTHAFSYISVALVSLSLSGPFCLAVGGLFVYFTARQIGVGALPSFFLAAALVITPAWVGSARALEVYSFSAVMFLGLVWALSRVSAGAGNWYGPIAFFLVLGASHHGLVLVGGVLLVAMHLLYPTLRSRSIRLLPAILGFGILCTAFLMYHPLRSGAAGPGTWDWCSPGSPEGLVCLLSGEGFRQFGGSVGQVLANLKKAVDDFWPQVLMMAVVALAGLKLSGLPRQRTVSFTILFVLGLVLSSLYMTREKEAFSAVFLAVLVLPAAQGLLALGPRIGTAVSGIGLVLAVGWLGFKWPTTTEGRGGEELSFQIIQELEDNSLLLVDWDQDPYLHYLFWQEAGLNKNRVLVPAVDEKGKWMGVRGVNPGKNIQVVYTFLLPFDWYRKQVNDTAKKMWGRPLINRLFFQEMLPDKNFLVSLIFRDFSGTMPVYINKVDEQLLTKAKPGAYDYIPGPLVFQVNNKEDPLGTTPRGTDIVNNFQNDPPLAKQLARFLVQRGTLAYLNKEFPEAYFDFDRALKVDPNQYTAHWFLGLLMENECVISKSDVRVLKDRCLQEIKTNCSCTQGPENNCGSAESLSCFQQTARDCNEEKLTKCVVLEDKLERKIRIQGRYASTDFHYQSALRAILKQKKQEPDNPFHAIFLSKVYERLGDDKKSEAERLRAQKLMGGIGGLKP